MSTPVPDQAQATLPRQGLTDAGATERQLLEALMQLQTTNDNLQAALDASPDLIFEVDLQGRHIACHAAPRDLLIAPAAELIGKLVSDVMPPDAAALVMAALQEANTRGHSSGQQIELPLPARVAWFELSVARKHTPDNETPRFIVISRDITDRKLTETALLASEERLRSTFETMVEGIALNEGVFDETGVMIDYRILEVNNAFMTTADFRGAQVVGRLASDLYGMSEQTVKDFWFASRDRTEVLQTEYQSPISHRWFMVSTSPLVNQRFVTSFFDITARKRAKDALQTSLQEKEALLKEVHHRVKNNLQVIASLLRLESHRSKVPETIDVLQSMNGRIRAMAQLHESLYRSGTFASVDLGVYLRKIATQAFQAQQLTVDTARLTFSMGLVSVGMDQAISCGLLVNELISNCLKHGFPQGRSGEVCVELQSAGLSVEQSDLWCLRVSDTGVGLPPDFEDKRNDSLGMQLVGDLSKQLGGTLSIQSQAGEGATFAVHFKALAPVRLVMPL